MSSNSQTPSSSKTRAVPGPVIPITVPVLPVQPAALISCAILDGTFFRVVTTAGAGKGKNVKAECMLCKPNKQSFISGSFDATSNFKLHLKRVHPDKVAEFELYKKKSKRDGADEDDTGGHGKRGGSSTLPTKPGGTKQVKLTQFSSLYKPSQSKVDKLITNFIVHAAQPLAVVEHPAFIQLVTGLESSANVMSRRTLGRRIDSEFKSVMTRIKDVLEVQKYVCTTADIWSMKTRSFMGVTVHWLDVHSLKRCSAAIACSRFAGIHSYDKIAESLDSICNKYGLTHEKIVSTVTDNGSNFVKAFKEFGIRVEVVQEDESDEEDLGQLYDGEGVASIEDPREDFQFATMTSEEDEIGVIEAEEGSNESNFEVGDSKSDRIILSNHLRCASHTLSLIATTDIKNALKQSHAVSRLHHTSMGKCSALWNAAGRPKSAEIIKDILGHQLSYPCPTRWNSLYDSLSQLLKSRDKIAALHVALGMKALIRENEWEYLTEHCLILKPLSVALDRLQGEDDCYYGHLLPTLFSLKSKLKNIQLTNLKHCHPLLRAIIENLDRRFKHFFDLAPEVSEAILAASSHPTFKVRWLPPNVLERETARIQRMMLTAIESIETQVSTNGGVPLPNALTQDTNTMSISDDDDFYDFNDKGEGPVSPQNQRQVIELEVLHFMSDSRKCISMLDCYPYVKKIFHRFNTSLSSSAPVERLFSFASLINSPRRHQLSDKNFKQLVLLKANTKYSGI